MPSASASAAGCLGGGVTLASTFAPALGLSVHQQRIGFAVGVLLMLLGVVLYLRQQKSKGSNPHAAQQIRDEIVYILKRLDEMEGSRPPFSGAVQSLSTHPLPATAWNQHGHSLKGVISDAQYAVVRNAFHAVDAYNRTGGTFQNENIVFGTLVLRRLLDQAEEALP
jgi:hypothetical protein